MIRSLISLIFFVILFFIFGSSLFEFVGKVFYWIADLIEKTGFVSLFDKISTVFNFNI